MIKTAKIFNNRIPKFNSEFKTLISKYDASSANSHRQIWESFFLKANKIQYLKKHRDYVEIYDFGYGERPFHYMWWLLVNQMPKNFKFLEIGVFKGQVLSLIQLLAMHSRRNVKIIGVTPLTNKGDENSVYPDIDYRAAIKKIYFDFKLPFRNTKIIKGYSQNAKVVQTVLKAGPFDIVYIDGSHEYEIVRKDIRNYSKALKNGGLLVLDDSAKYLNLPQYVNTSDNLFKRAFGIGKVKLFHGHDGVSKAVKSTVEKNPGYKYLFACGHNRVWLKV